MIEIIVYGALIVGVVAFIIHKRKQSRPSGSGVNPGRTGGDKPDRHQS